jgi:penicillin-binding protein 2
MKNLYENRKFAISLALILVALIFIIKLFYLQIVNTSYRLSAENNVIRYVPQFPARGLIFDRKGKLVVHNEAAYDLMVIPSQLEVFDTSGLCEILMTEKEEFIKNLKAARAYSPYIPSSIIKQINPKTYAKLQEKLYRFPGFYVHTRTLRKYSQDIAAHLLGYVGEVTEKEIARDDYYKMGDYIGKSGIEKSYESDLRGQKGVKMYLVDVHNRIKGSYQNGRHDKDPIVGANLTATFDANLQAYGENLMQNKIGSIVAIEPSTGEILSLVSTPGYKPSLLVGRVRSKNYLALARDTLKPLFNRALMASYPPGSTFKTLNGLIGLQEKTLYPSMTYGCTMGYHSRGLTVGCHNHRSPLNLPSAVQISCNAYFCNVFRNILDSGKYTDIHESFDTWRNYLLSFGFGQKISLDLPNELKGFIPKSSYYDRYYGKKGWSSLTIISLAIGQGELGITPIQLANMTAAIANRGHYFSPHIIKAIAGRDDNNVRFMKRHDTMIDSIHFSPIIHGMEMAVNGAPGSGSTARIAKIDSIIVCGKTGTAQNPHGKDHSIFIAFAPKDNPEIAIAVFVENGGFGSTYAAPIASLMIEKYLKGKIKKNRKWIEDRMLKSDLIHGEQKK